MISSKYRLFVLVIVMLTVASYGPAANWIKYVDEKGQVHIVDDVSKVPDKYRKKANEVNFSKDGMIMHRVQAGSPNAEGWYEAVSTEGSFKVLLPIPFNDFSIKDKKGSVAYAIGSKSAEGFKFFATKMSIKTKDPAGEAASFLKKSKESPYGSVTHDRTFEFAGHPAVELRVSDNKMAAWERLIVLPDAKFMLTVEYPVTKESEISPAIQKFFDSLRV